MSDSDEVGALLVQQCNDSTAVDANETNNNAAESFEAKSVLKGKRRGEAQCGSISFSREIK